MINLESISLENFVSWGPYNTSLQLSNMEQCFIAGHISDNSSSYRKSNGAGKSSLMQAISWCLFGKTVYNQNPGNRVLNWFTSDNAKVSIRLKNGDEITRIRTRSGDTELLYKSGSQEIINCTLSTTSNQQRLLEKELNLDYNLFCGSVFFSQYRQPWLAMQDQMRRQTFERIMGIDRLSIYSEVAKGKYEKALYEQGKRKIKIESLNSSIANSIKQLEQMQQSAQNFEASRESRRLDKMKYALECKERYDQYVLEDVLALEKKWNVVAKINEKINNLQSQINSLNLSISNADNTKLQAIMKLRDKAQTAKNKINQSAIAQKESISSECKSDVSEKCKEITSLNQKIYNLRSLVSEQKCIIQAQDNIINKWLAKAGKICTECERELPENYATSKIDEPKLLKRQAEEKITGYQENIKNIEDQVVKLSSQCTRIEAISRSKLDAVTADTTKMLSAIDTQLVASIDEAAITAEEIKSQLLSNKSKLEETVKSARNKVAMSSPSMTVNEAKQKNSCRDSLLVAMQLAYTDAEKISTEKNTYNQSVINLGEEIKKNEELIKKEQKDLETYDIILSHLLYIQKAYSDRRKIKSYLISKHQPYFNSRLHHYLDLFELDIRISLTDSLGIDSNLWGYDFQSGGERGRTDLAFMFAVFDLHQGIHGPQSNMLVLDEPEKALDEAGRQMLISIIKDDLATRFESIFIISHDDCFRDVFPHQVTIERTDRLSHIIDVR